MKRSFLVLAVVCGIFLVSFTGGVRLAAQAAKESYLACYAVLYPYHDRIGVYASPTDYNAGKEPLRIIDTPLYSLPQQDQIAIQNGIILQNDTDLRQYTEDFGICQYQTIL